MAWYIATREENRVPLWTSILWFQIRIFIIPTPDILCNISVDESTRLRIHRTLILVKDSIDVSIRFGTDTNCQGTLSFGNTPTIGRPIVQRRSPGFHQPGNFRRHFETVAPPTRSPTRKSNVLFTFRFRSTSRTRPTIVKGRRDYFLCCALSVA